MKSLRPLGLVLLLTFAACTPDRTGLNRLGESDKVPIRILYRELAHAVVHHFGAPRKIDSPTEFFG